MKLPVMTGRIERRILANFRVQAGVLAKVLPPPFRPKLVRGFGIAGICLIRLGKVRPRGLPAAVGVTSENAAHRIAVEWDENGAVREGVFIPRRDTSSTLNKLAGGRIFPGVHSLARFQVDELGDEYRVALASEDGVTKVRVEGRVAAALPEDSIFESLDEVSAFFERGSLGYSATAKPCCYEGLELVSFTWSVQPLGVTKIESSFFEDRSRFPDGSVTFDNALLMRGIEHEWHARAPMQAAAAGFP